MKYTPFEDIQCPPDWRVEAIDPETSKALIAIFSGPCAKERAREYAHFKNAPEATAVATPVPAHTNTLVVEVQNGRKLTLHLNGLLWTHDNRRNTVTARPKDMIEPVVVDQLGGE